MPVNKKQSHATNTVTLRLPGYREAVSKPAYKFIVHGFYKPGCQYYYKKFGFSQINRVKQKSGFSCYKPALLRPILCKVFVI